MSLSCAFRWVSDITLEQNIYAYVTVRGPKILLWPLGPSLLTVIHKYHTHNDTHNIDAGRLAAQQPRSRPFF